MLRFAIAGQLNIAEIRPVDVTFLMTQIDGLGERVVISVDNKRPGVITEQWMETTWRYLAVHANECDLSVAEKSSLHLISQNECRQLVLLSRSEPIVSVDENTDTNTVEAFQLLGATVLESVPRYVSFHRHISMYLSSVNDATGILDTLRRMSSKFSNKSFLNKIVNLPESHKHSFRNTLCHTMVSYNKILSEADKKILKSLKLFQVLPFSGFQQFPGFISVSEAGIGAYSWRTELHVQQPVLDLTDGLVSSMVKKLGGVQVLEDFQILKSYVLRDIMSGNLNVENVTKTMCSICSYFQAELDSNKENILTTIRSVRFISTQSATLATAEELYDDTEPILAQMFQGLDLFPRGVFADEKYRPLLRRLGLRGTDNVKPVHIIDRAKYLDANSQTAELDSVRIAMMTLLNERHDLLCRDELQELHQLKWICPLRRRPDNYPSSLNFVAEPQRPDAVCIHTYARLIGSHKVTVDEASFQRLAEYFRWMDSPAVTDVVNHLLNVITWYTAEERSTVDAMTVRILCEQICEYLENCLQRDTSLCSFVEPLTNVACVFIDNQFVLPRVCAFSSQLGLQCFPTMVTIPVIMASNFKKLLQSVGVRDQFDVEDYIFMLHNIRTKAGDFAVSQDTLTQISFIANELFLHIKEPEQFPENSVICLPDSDGFLHPASELCYSESASADLIAKHHLRTCHPIISQTVAVGLRVKTAEKQILGHHVIGMPFGQREELVTRLKRILTGYPFDSGILYELLQNADDAGATKVHFILDERQLSTERVFDEGWKHIVYPALCVYNDKPFTERDITGIQSLGKGSKAEDPLKTGKFGVGFNCVYHITDVPTFLTSVNSKRVLCVLDPTCKHMLMSTTQSPGYRINVNDDIMQLYPDVFDCYLEEEYGEAEGTVFRFPLRQSCPTRRETAEDKTIISNRPVSCEEINKLLSNFKDCIHECLLFLRNVTEISLRHATSYDGNTSIQEMLVVNAKIAELQKYATFSSQLRGVATDLVDGNLKVADVQKREHCFRVTTTDGKGTEKQWLVVRRLGLENNTKENLPEVLQAMDNKHELKLVPRADVAYMLNSNERVSCRLFCFLPLPVKQKQPVHINGDFALEYENRRNLWKLEDGGYKADWNVCILEGVVAPAYLRLLHELKDNFHSPVMRTDLIQYRDAFPIASHQEDMVYIRNLSLAVYALISAREAELLPCYSNRIPLTVENLNWVAPVNRMKHRLSPCFALLKMPCTEVPDRAGTTSRGMRRILTSGFREESEVLRETLVASGLQLIISSFSSLFHNFKEAGLDVVEFTPEYVLTFYQTQYRLNAAKCKLNETSFRNISNLECVLRYCSEAKHFKIRLLQTSLLLTADEYLQTFDPSDVKFVCRYQTIVPQSVSDFVHQDLVRVLQLNPFRDICLCKKFGLLQFAEALPQLLPEEQFRNNIHTVESMIPVSRLFDYISINMTGRSENDENRMAVSVRWLKEVWTFLASELHSNADRIVRCYFEKLCGKLKKKPMKEVFERRLVAAQLTAGDYCKWCLVPVVAGDNRLLVPFEKMIGVVDGSDIKHRFSSELCERLKFPTVDQEVFDTNLQWLTEIYAPSAYKNEVLVIKSFYVFDYSHILLERKESKELANFFACNLTLWRGIPEAVQSLKRLYLFEDVSGRVVRLCDFEACFVMSSEVPEVSADCQAWMNAVNDVKKIVLLKHNSKLENLVLHLQCAELTPADFYMKYMFEYFQFMSEQERRKHLNHICFRLIHSLRQYGNYQHKYKNPEPHCECQYCIFRRALRRLPFLHSDDNSGFKVASFFYDPRVPLFANMVDESFFPPIYFPDHKAEWLNFLCDCGLVHKVTEDKLLEFAEQLSRNQPNVVKFRISIDKLSDMILDELVSKFENESDSYTVSHYFLQAFSQVSFIPLSIVDEELRALHPQAGVFNDSALTLVQLRGSAKLKDSPLLWTRCNILPSKVTERFQSKLLERLSVCLNPAVYDVAANLENVCSVCTKRGEGLLLETEQRQTLAYVLTTMFAYFQKRDVRNVSGRLQSVRCILIENEHLVLPKHVIFSIHCEIRPYLFKFPLEFGQFEDLFESLGVSSEPKPEHYVQVLTTIHQHAEDSVLLPQQRLATTKALKGVFRCLREKLSFDKVNELHLPSGDGKLYSSRQLTVRDNQSFSERLTGDLGLPILLDVNQSTLHISTEVAVELLNKLPKQIRPQLMSTVFKECLKAPSECGDVDVMDTGLVSMVTGRLFDPHFRQGLYRLAVHVLRYLGKLDETHVKQAKRLIAALDNISVIQRSRLTTYLDYVGKFPAITKQVREQIRATSEAVCPYFVEQQRVYIGARSEGTHDSLYATLAEVINAMTNNLLTSVLHHVYIILRCDVATIQQHLDMVNIKPCDNFADNDSQVVKTGQFATKCNGDIVVALKQQISLW